MLLHYPIGFRTIGSWTGKMGTKTNGSRTNGSGLGQRNNCPGPICPRIIQSMYPLNYDFLVKVLHSFQSLKFTFQLLIVEKKTCHVKG